LAEERHRQRRLIIDTLILGVVGALAAQLFTLMLRAANWLFLEKLAHYKPPTLSGEGGTLQQVIGPFGLWLIPIATTLGGLIVGFLIDRIAPEAEGHGTDTAVRAFHRAEGFLRARVAPVKMVASAITIGSGGAAGREGPVALIAAGFGSLYATVMGRSEEDRRLMLLVGMASGLSAIFRSPVGTAIFAIEVLYSDMVFESGALLYTMIGAIVAYALNGLFVGYTPLFHMPAELRLAGPLSYLWYLVLGVAAGLVGLLLPLVFYNLRDWFRHLAVPFYLKPALGGLGVGLIALALPQVLGGGYGWMQLAIDGRIAAGTLVFLLFAKILALSLSVSSGGSGGVFAPSLFIGAMLGGTFAYLLHEPAAAFVVVGMAAVFSAAAHVPIASLMMVTEMTGGYTLLVPAALAVMVSYLVQTRIATSQRLKYRGLYESQVADSSASPAHHTEHLKIALRILKEQGVSNPSDVGQFDLLSLLRSGIPVELPDNRRVVIGVLRPNSVHANKPIGGEGGRLDENTNIIAIIRGEHMMVPRPDTVLQPGDRLILLSNAAGLDSLKSDVDRW
jgi:chloride channel protein, CIC family